MENSGSLELEKVRDPAAFAAESFHFLATASIFIVVLLSPWLFASWEMWWFWPMVAVLAIGCLFSGLGVLTKILLVNDSGAHYTGRGRLPTRVFLCLLAILPFMVYAGVRALIPAPHGLPLVAMEVERSLLLFASPVALAAVTMLSTKRVHRRVLTWFVILNFFLIAVCGTVNHFATNDASIMWVAANNFAYFGRASAPFYCPNHYSAYLNIGICLLVATAFTLRAKVRAVLLALCGAAVLLAADFLSLSRGGLASLGAGLLATLPLLGFRGRVWWKRLTAFVVVVAALSAAFLAVRYTDNGVMRRLSSHPLWKTWEKNELGSEEFGKALGDAFWYNFDRGTYIASALRAWQSAPIIGIGPGQHANRWLQFAASSDGVRFDYLDPKSFKKPRALNLGYHLYEVHSDWTQLLEEYGIVGVALFVVGMLGVGAMLLPRQRALEKGDALSLYRALPLGVLCASAGLFFHSFFDFSLQMPCIVWLMAFLVAAALLEDGLTPSSTPSDDNFNEHALVTGG